MQNVMLRARPPNGDCLIRLIWRQMEKLDNVTMITSPNDADGQLAYMCEHTVDAVLMFSDDTDMLLFPSCHAKAIFNVTFGQGDVKVLGYVKGEHPFSCKTQATTTKPSEGLDMSTWPIFAVMAYACMRGCDYGHIHGYGPVRAHQQSRTSTSTKDCQHWQRGAFKPCRPCVGPLTC